MKSGRRIELMVLLVASLLAAPAGATELPVSARSPENEIMSDSPLFSLTVPFGLEQQGAIYPTVPAIANLMLGGTWIRENSVWMLADCLNHGAACKLNAAETGWATTILDRLKNDPAFASVFFAYPTGEFYPPRTAADQALLVKMSGLSLGDGLFDHNSPEPGRFAITGSGPGPIIFNMAQLDTRVEPGRSISQDPFLFIAMFFHEAAHQVDVKDDAQRLPDAFGSKIAEYLKTRITSVHHFEPAFAPFGVVLDQSSQGPIPLSGVPYAGTVPHAQAFTSGIITDGRVMLVIQDYVQQTFLTMFGFNELYGTWLYNPKWSAPVWRDAGHNSGTVNLEIQVSFALAKTDHSGLLLSNGRSVLTIPFDRAPDGGFRFADAPLRITTRDLDQIRPDKAFPSTSLGTVKGDFVAQVSEGQTLDGTLELELPAGSVPEALGMRAEFETPGAAPTLTGTVMPRLHLYMDARRIEQLDATHFRFYFSSPTPPGFQRKDFTYTEAYVGLKGQANVVRIPFAKPFVQTYLGSATAPPIKMTMHSFRGPDGSAWTPGQWINAQSGGLDVVLNMNSITDPLPYIFLVFEIQTATGSVYCVSPVDNDLVWHFISGGAQTISGDTLSYRGRFDLSQIPMAGTAVRPVGIKMMDTTGRELTIDF